MRRARAATALVLLALAGCGGGGDGGVAAGRSVTFGFADGLYGGAEGRRAAREADRLGAQVVRVLVRWASVERAPGTPDWSAVDDEVRALEAAGVKALPVITSAPPWAHDPADACPDVLCPPAPEHEADLAAFAAALAGRYGADVLHGIEVLNEPNSTVDWHAKGGPDPERYARILKTTAAAIRRAAPDVPVVFGGLAPTKDIPTSGRLSTGTFLRRAYAAGARGSFDAIGVHVYAHPDEAADPPALERLDGSLDEAREARRAAQDGEVPLWITETGYATGMPARNGLPEVPGEVTPAEQGPALLAAYDHLAEMSDVELVLLWRLRDDAAAPREKGFGVLNGDWSPKPAAAELGRRFGTR